MGKLSEEGYDIRSAPPLSWQKAQGPERMTSAAILQQKAIWHTEYLWHEVRSISMILIFCFPAFEHFFCGLCASPQSIRVCWRRCAHTAPALDRLLLWIWLAELGC